MVKLNVRIDSPKHWAMVETTKEQIKKAQCPICNAQLWLAPDDSPYCNAVHDLNKNN